MLHGFKTFLAFLLMLLLQLGKGGHNFEYEMGCWAKKNAGAALNASTKGGGRSASVALKRLSRCHWPC